MTWCNEAAEDGLADLVGNRLVNAAAFDTYDFERIIQQKISHVRGTSMCLCYRQRSATHSVVGSYFIPKPPAAESGKCSERLLTPIHGLLMFRNKNEKTPFTVYAAAFWLPRIELNGGVARRLV